METALAFIVGGMYAAGLYMMLRRSVVRLLIGLVILGNAANLLIFTSGGLLRGSPPLVPDGLTTPPGPVADPLPQALILTAIVISFGVLAFAMTLVHRTHRMVGSDDIDDLRRTDS
ncbi:MAG: cation:proton antiporter [Myxococcales bacterium]